MVTWVSGGKTTVSYDSSKKHYYMTDVSCRAVMKYAYLSSGHIFYYFTPGGSSTSAGTNTLRDGDVISQTIPQTSGTVEAFIYAGTYSTPACSSVSATQNYGSKAVPTVYGSPSSGYVNPFGSYVFSFGVNAISGIQEQYSVSNGTFYYKESDASTYQSLAMSGRYYALPANTLTTGKTYNYYAKLTLDDGTVATTPTYTITTVDGTPSTVGKSPKQAIIYGFTDFSWNYSNTRGTAQYAYDLQISQDNESWTTIFNHVVSRDTTSDVYDGISAGTWYWRVRAYNNDNVVSAWSEPLSFICNVAPDAPVINNIDTIGRVTASWTSSSQVAFHVVIIKTETDEIIYDSGEIYSSETQYTANEYLPNGDYTLKVQTINEFGKQSPYTSAEFTISTQLPDPDVTAEYSSSLNGVMIQIANSTAERYYLKRNGELVASFTGDTYVDVFASGKTDYVLIAVDTNDNFGQVSFTVFAAVESARIITKDGQILEVSERWNQRFELSSQEEIKYSANEYLGASAPEHLFSSMRTKRISLVFFDPDRIASKLLGQVVFYADQFGNGDWVAVVSVGRDDKWYGDETAVQLELTTKNEAITYDD